MIRTQIQLTQKQADALKALAAKKKVSVAEMIRMSVDAMLKTNTFIDDQTLRKKALQAAGIFNGPEDLASNHDDYLSEVYGK